jgi:hypothetical protein
MCNFVSFSLLADCCEIALPQGPCQQAFRFPYSLLPNTLPRLGAGRTSIAPMTALHALSPRRTRFQPRQEILEEVVAGLLWMQLDLPRDVGRGEMQAMAHRLVTRIRTGATETMVAAEIADFQLRRFCRPANLPVIRDLTRRSVDAVRGC